jgi:glycosyltransferase involved in cell wall biosynthesis
VDEPENDPPSRPVELSVVIPAHNEANRIGHQLETLVTQEWDGAWEVIVVDNCSTDDTAAVVAGHARADDRIRLVHAIDRPSLNYARNVGIRASAAPSFALVDADDIVGPRWLASMGSALREHAFVTGPLELDRLNPPELAASRGRDDEWRLPTFCGKFPTAHGNNIGMHRALYERVGGFDDDPRILGAEDIEMSMRAWLAGADLRFEAGAVVHYRYRTEPRALWQQGRRYGRARPMVARLTRERGLGRPPRFGGWRSWAWLVIHLPDTMHPTRRAAWTWVAGNRIGQLEGSIRYRVLFI